MRLAERPENSIASSDFSTESFCRLVQSCSGAPHVNSQVAYLAGLLQELDARTMVVEHHYIDRHFMEESASYYSRCLVHKPNSCARLHFFTALRDGRVIDDAELDDLLGEAGSGGRADTESLLQASYLGFIVVRPLPSVPIGRTVVSVRPSADGVYSTVEYTVHFLGFELRVTGLAFQQQDRAVGACATTACWTALQRLCRHEGRRTATPFEITESAVRHFLPAGRPFPSPGLTVEQISAALRSLDFPPLLFEPGGRPDLFLLRLGIYLASRIPVILALDLGDRVGHAVTVVGVDALTDTFVWREEIDGGDGPSPEVYEFRARNRSYERIYIHDDRIGPFVPAHLELDEERVILQFEVPLASDKEALVDLAIVPLYPKLRTSGQDLFEAATGVLPLLDRLSGAGDDLTLDIFFDRSGSYLAKLYDLPANAGRLVGFQKRIALSRYVGIIRWETPSGLLLDTVWDTTDIGRETRQIEQLLGVVCYEPALFKATDTLAAELGVIAG